jgi:uncharacterized protein (DUF342 family)
LTAGVVERCLIKSIGDVNLKFGALNSMIVCCGNVIGPEASIVGGVTIADERIEVAILGSDVKVETLLTINNIEKNRSRRKLLHQLARVVREETALEEKLTLGFPSLKEALANPTDRVRLLAQTLIKTQKVKKELEVQLEAIPPGPENPNAGVICHGKIYKGVSISINGIAWTAEKDINGPVRITLVNSQVEMLRL